MKLKWLIACECSGIVRDALRRRGHAAWSCDLKPSEQPSEYHFQCDVRKIIRNGWDAMICHPDCTFLASSGLHWNGRIPGRAQKTEEALDFVRFLLGQDIPFIGLENPQGCIGTRIRPADQYIQPYEFGENASKKTGLWLKNLPLLCPTAFAPPRIVNGKKRWGNQTDNGQNNLGPSKTRKADRARTYQGIADAIAEQWGRAIDD